MVSERADLISILFQKKRHLTPEHHAGIADGSFADNPLRPEERECVGAGPTREPLDGM